MRVLKANSGRKIRFCYIYCSLKKLLQYYSSKNLFLPNCYLKSNSINHRITSLMFQVPSESSVGTNSTASSEVSRPVSLTSLGSCSSSGSSGMNQPGSAYLASAESLDSDPEPTGSQGKCNHMTTFSHQSYFFLHSFPYTANLMETISYSLLSKRIMNLFFLYMPL